MLTLPHGDQVDLVTAHVLIKCLCCVMHPYPPDHKQKRNKQKSPWEACELNIDVPKEFQKPEMMRNQEWLEKKKQGNET